MNNIRVRFAPSPTGIPHLGNARTAIINYIFAKQNNGKFLLRIEDTDRARSTEENTQHLLKMLEWFEMPFDEVPLIQSHRFDIYTEKAKFLYENNFAYYCTCIKNEDAEIQIPICQCRNASHTNGVLRFKVVHNVEMSFDDVIYKTISINTTNIEDFALVRSDGIPTYMLCVVIDDIFSNITHVIRGEDHRTNTFKQIMLYNAFKSKHPIFAHMPMVLGTDKKKLSKRNGGSSVEYFKSLGIHAKGFINYMMRLGWGYGNQEYFTIDELIKCFNLSNVKTSAAVFDINKMLKCSEFFIKKDIEDNISYKLFEEYIKEYKDIKNIDIIHKYDMNVYISLYNDIAKRCKTYSEIYDMISFIWCEVSLKTNINKEEWQRINEILQTKYHDEQEFILKLVEEKLHKTFRMIITGNNIGPDLTLAIKCIGYENIKQKMQFAAEFFNV